MALVQHHCVVGIATGQIHVVENRQRDDVMFACIAADSIKYL
jgi:hypothetical protein